MSGPSGRPERLDVDAREALGVGEDVDRDDPPVHHGERHDEPCLRLRRHDDAALRAEVGVGLGRALLDAPTRTAGELPHRLGRAVEHDRDLVERHREHVVQDERQPLRRPQRLEDDEQRQPDVVREDRLVLRVLPRRGLHDRPGSRPAGVEYVAGDLATGEGVPAALAGVGVVVHCAGSATGDDAKTRTLVDAAVDAGIEHLVHISVVGVDRIPVRTRVDRAQFGYFEAKRLSEEIVTSSGLPWTILRATQFHDFVTGLVDQLGRMPVVPAFAGVKLQPVDARDVADRLTELALGEPRGLVAELGGPAAYQMTDLVHDYLHAIGRHRLVLPMRNPGKAAAAYRAGANLTPEHATGMRTWEDFLAERTHELAA